MVFYLEKSNENNVDVYVCFGCEICLRGKHKLSHLNKLIWTVLECAWGTSRQNCGIKPAHRSCERLECNDQRARCPRTGGTIINDLNSLSS
jgi:hypothetical protein